MTLDDGEFGSWLSIPHWDHKDLHVLWKEPLQIIVQAIDVVTHLAWWHHRNFNVDHYTVAWTKIKLGNRADFNRLSLRLCFHRLLSKHLGSSVELSLGWVHELGTDLLVR